MNRAQAAAIARAAHAAKILPMPERFWSKVDMRGPDECWPWKACIRNKEEGYGAFMLGGKLRPAHQIAWELMNGAMPSGMNACHRCDNPVCCNPSHIFPGSHAMNMADKTAKGRQVKGASVHTAKITEQDVAAIRALKTFTNRAPVGLRASIAAQYGITKCSVTEIWAFRTWKSI